MPKRKPPEYPNLDRYNVRIIPANDHSPPGVDRADFMRALEEAGLTEWFKANAGCSTRGSNGMYPWDAERYLSRRRTLD